MRQGLVVVAVAVAITVISQQHPPQFKTPTVVMVISQLVVRPLLDRLMAVAVAVELI